MKLLPSPSNLRRATDGGDMAGRGLEAVITVVLFMGLGWLLDRWLGTDPWLMIGLFLFAAVGVFITFKARYMAYMEQLDEQRRERGAR